MKTTVDQKIVLFTWALRSCLLKRQQDFFLLFITEDTTENQQSCSPTQCYLYRLMSGL